MRDASSSGQPYRFQRRYRLTTPADFQRVFTQAQRSADRFFTVLYRDNDCGTARLGFAIARKRIASAVHRNRVRRLARESFRLRRADLPHVDIIILAQPAAARATRTELRNSLDKHWGRLSGGSTSGTGT